MADIIIKKRRDRSGLAMLLSNSVKGSLWIQENIDTTFSIGAVQISAESVDEMAELIAKDNLEVDIK